MQITVRNHKVINETEKSFTIMWRPKRVYHIPKSQIISKTEKDGDTIFEVTDYIYKKLTR